MKTKILIIGLLLGIFLVSVSFSQTDSVKSYYINKVKVSPGKYYEYRFFNGTTQNGKLVGVTENTILVYKDNSIAEYNISDIISMNNIEPEYIINSTNNTGRRNKSTWSISAGYTNNKTDDHYQGYYANDESKGKKGFNIQGDMVVKLSDDFGFRADLSYMHTFSTTSETSNNIPNYYYTYKTEYGDNNIFAIKTGILVGSVGDYNNLNFYAFFGGGMLYTFPFEIKSNSNSQYYYNYTDEGGDEMELGFVGSIRLGYKINKKYSLFIEPSFHWWSGYTNRTININGGITFNL